MKKTIFWALPWLCLCLNFGCATSTAHLNTYRKYLISGYQANAAELKMTRVLVMVNNNLQLNQAGERLADQGFIIIQVKPVSSTHDL